MPIAGSVRPFVFSICTALILFAPAGCAGSTPQVESAPDIEKPKLVVLLIFDQMRGDYLSRWQELFEKDGFRRLTRDGAWFQDCHYPNANTITGPGHATVATGCTPRTHGIVGNEWYDRTSRKVISCVQNDRYTQVPPLKSNPKGGGASPQRLLAPTLADAMKEQLGKDVRVVALSFKDRSAILPAGKTPDACYWADKEGQFVTSTYYRDSLHDWVKEFNRSKFVDRWFGKQWVKLNPSLDYTRWSGPDDVIGEGRGYEQGRTFPHPFDGGKKKSKAVYYQSLGNSPFGNDVLLALAKKAVEGEKLGTDKTPDFLSISFSSNDTVGHSWGPDSQEVLDTTLRTDRIVKELLDFLDEKVGKGKYTVAVTADHGICPLPEVSRTRGLEARRVLMKPMLQRAEEFLDSQFPVKKDAKPGMGKWIETTRSNMLYLDRKRIALRGAKQADVESALAKWLSKQPGMQTALTRSELLASGERLDTLFHQARLMFHPERCGDIVVVPRKYHLLVWSEGSLETTGTTHGAPHSYDTHVPLVVMGPGIAAGVRHDRVSPELTAVLLAKSLGIRPPAQAHAKVPAR